MGVKDNITRVDEVGDAVPGVRDLVGRAAMVTKREQNESPRKVRDN